MIKSGSFENYECSVYSVDLNINSPESGFEFSLMETGYDGSWKTANLVTISGVSGYLFDQSGNFFGGFQSGIPFNVKIYYDYDNKTFSYDLEDVLMANSLDVTGYDVFETGLVNLAMFHKHGDSSATVVGQGVKS
jgi:hypothetical protein